MKNISYFRKYRGRRPIQNTKVPQFIENPSYKEVNSVAIQVDSEDVKVNIEEDVGSSSENCETNVNSEQSNEIFDKLFGIAVAGEMMETCLNNAFKEIENKAQRSKEIPSGSKIITTV